MFDKATRKKLRFECAGVLTVEDLWDLPIDGKQRSLMTIAKKLHAEIKESEVDILGISKKTKVNEDLQLRFDIVKYIIETLTAESEARKKKAENRVKRQQIMETIMRKQDEEREGKSLEELHKMLDELEAEE